MLLGEPHMFVHFVSECILTKFDQSSWQNLSIFELMNLIHNHWGKSSEARNREIFRARLTAGKIIRNQDEQGQLSWGLGSCCLNFCNFFCIFIYWLPCHGDTYAFQLASARLDWSASYKMDVSWFYPAWHSNEPNVKTSHQFVDALADQFCENHIT
jgi:hypothetical protein